MPRKNKAALGHHKFYGSTTIGSRGQVVIPIKARREFKLKAGDDVLVSGSRRRFLMLIKSSEMKGIMDELSSHIKEFEKEVSKRKKR